jgi:phosphatidylserine decarboxylase
MAMSEQALRPGRWLPAKSEVRRYVAGLSAGLAARAVSRPLHPAVAEFAALIETDPIVRMYVTRMIEEVPEEPAFAEHHVRSVGGLLTLIDEVVRHAPAFDTTALVGTPLNAVLDWSMGTPAGFAAFRHPPINAALGRILNAWCAFLDSPASLHVLHDGPGGWRSPAARAVLHMDDFVHDPDDAHWGFASWNDFFTRRLRPGVRPLAGPHDPRAIANPCEATPFRVARDVRLTDRFWLKSQPYSLRDMLAGDPAAAAFDGGTVYQAFLSALNYHRWHAPLSGRILRTQLIPGTYFSELETEGEDPAGPNNSQAYLAHVATRALILIEADEATIGLTAALFVGMGEVSSCRIDPAVAPGARIAKGQELGLFQFGGSTCCLVFRPGAIESFDPAAQRPWTDADAAPIPLGATIARAR